MATQPTTFDPAQWLARWQTAGGSYALIGGRPYIGRLINGPRDLEAMADEVNDPTRREQLRDYLANIERQRMGEA